jgi:hypothetical protein
MYISKRTAVALLTASALVGSATTAVTALADHGGRDRGATHREDGNRMVLFSSLAPSVPSDPSLLGAAAGNVPWVLRSGEAKLQSDGRLTVRIRGLLIPSGPSAGTTGPVKTVSASLYCGPNSTPVGTSKTVPLSSHGDVRIATRLTLPTKCQIPAVLIHPSGTLGAYIATSGFGG